jgi:hypothetical protein
MAGLVPAIHIVSANKMRMPATKAGMTNESCSCHDEEKLVSRTRCSVLLAMPPHRPVTLLRRAGTHRFR